MDASARRYRCHLRSLLLMAAVVVVEMALVVLVIVVVVVAVGSPPSCWVEVVNSWLSSLLVLAVLLWSHTWFGGSVVKGVAAKIVLELSMGPSRRYR